MFYFHRATGQVYEVIRAKVVYLSGDVTGLGSQSRLLDMVEKSKNNSGLAELEFAICSLLRLVQLGGGSSSNTGQPIAMQLSLKGLLRSPEARHEADQSTVSAVSQTAKNHISGPSGEDNQRAGVQQFPPVHRIFYRAHPPEGYRLCEDLSSDDHL
ncbi:hypothetical protein J6590_080669 [Homalodisca vitripennis]|nr:hypothetical protein J6590_080669 [Homalodisca vitripennis]